VCDFHVSFAEALPYPDHHFDALIAPGLLGNIRDDRPVLNEMYRVLKPGGCLLVTVPNRLALDLMIALPRSLPIYFLGTRFRQHLRIGGNLLRSLLRRSIKPEATLTYGRLVTPRAFVKRLYQHGFSKVRYIPLTFGPIMPFGIRWTSDQSLVRISDAIASWVAKTGHFRWGGTSMLYVAYRKS
jgi:ubiquinone/menaquinone biosynthesis C-methylase UbiE